MPAGDGKLVITEIVMTHPQGFGGHEFELTPDDVFACVTCGRYEIALRRADGTIPDCTGPARPAAHTHQVDTGDEAAQLPDGTPVTVVGPVWPGGNVLVQHGDGHLDVVAAATLTPPR